jgi:hypothetical protein
MASKVRPNSPALRKFTSPATTFPSVFRSPRAPFMSNQGESTISGPHGYQKTILTSPPSRSIMVPSPLAGASSQTTAMLSQTESPYSSPIDAATSSVRLVSDTQQDYRREDYMHGKISQSSPSLSGSDSSPPLGRASLVSHLESAYYPDVGSPHDRVTGSKGRFYSQAINPNSTRSTIQLCEEPENMVRKCTLAGMQPSDSIESNLEMLQDKKPQLSLFLTLFMLLVVTVVCSAVDAKLIHH